jgi:hypothetical protein
MSYYNTIHWIGSNEKHGIPIDMFQQQILYTVYERYTLALTFWQQFDSINQS